MESQSWTDPAPGAPVTRASLADLNVAQQAITLAGLAKYFIPDPDCRVDGRTYREALDVLKAAEALVAAVVVSALEHGTSWDELAAADWTLPETVQTRWQDAVSEWDERVSSAEHNVDMAPYHNVFGSDPHQIADRLDTLIAQHSPNHGEKAATALLKQMDIPAELNLIHRQRQQLAKIWSDPPPLQLAALADRETQLEELLATSLAQGDAFQRKLAKKHQETAQAAREARDKFITDVKAGNAGTPRKGPNG